MEFGQRFLLVAHVDQDRSSRHQIEEIGRNALQIVRRGSDEAAAIAHIGFRGKLPSVPQQRLGNVGKPNGAALGSFEGGERDQAVTASHVE